MTMQDALSAAALRGCYARPSFSRAYIYRFVPMGGAELVEVTGFNSRASGVETGFWRSMTRREIQAVWLVCDKLGLAVATETASADTRPKLSDLLQIDLP